MKRYGIMGGTFDPVHLGHLMVAEYVKEEMNLDEIIFVPTGNPPHKDNVTSALDRYNMVKLSIKDNETFRITDIETKRTGNSYSIDTIKELKKMERAEYYFIIGSDTLFLLDTWKNPHEIAKEIEYICALRPDYTQEDKINDKILSLREKFGMEVHLVKTPLYDISSTNVRKALREGRSLKYILNDKVIQYIQENHLYGR